MQEALRFLLPDAEPCERTRLPRTGAADTAWYGKSRAGLPLTIRGLRQIVR